MIFETGIFGVAIVSSETFDVRSSYIPTIIFRLFSILFRINVRILYQRGPDAAKKIEIVLIVKNDCIGDPTNERQCLHLLSSRRRIPRRVVGR